MQSFFSASFFASNRAALRRALKNDVPIVVPSNGLLQRNGDTTFPFVQDSNFWYLTGIDLPDCTLVMTPKGDYLLVASRDAVRVAFDGALDASELTERSGIADIVSEREGWKRLKSDLHGSVAIPEAPPAYIARQGFYTNPARRRVIEKLNRIRPALKHSDIRPILSELRCIKQAPELAALQHAIDITTQTIAEVRRPSQLAKFTHEYELEAAITHGFRSRGASGHAFGPIVANGRKATTLHNVSNDGQLATNQLTIIDIGAEVEHYAADITRTISPMQPSTRQTQVHNAVLEVQQFALDLLKPGTDPRHYEQAVEQKVGEKLRELKLITDADHEAIRRYFPHSSSHFLGLDTHDVGDYRKPLAAGMVITCEPGIYIPEEGIGVRIEDDILLTESGNKVLSAACPSKAF